MDRNTDAMKKDFLFIFFFLSGRIVIRSRQSKRIFYPLSTSKTQQNPAKSSKIQQNRNAPGAFRKAAFALRGINENLILRKVNRACIPTPTIPPKTRIQIAAEYQISQNTLRRRLGRSQVDLPAGSILPAHQRLLYERLGYTDEK